MKLSEREFQMNEVCRALRASWAFCPERALGAHLIEVANDLIRQGKTRNAPRDLTQIDDPFMLRALQAHIMKSKGINKRLVRSAIKMERERVQDWGTSIAASCSMRRLYG